MNIAILGAGAVAKTFMGLIISPDSTLKEKNMSVKVKYILDSQGGIYEETGIEPSLFTEKYSIKAHSLYKEGLRLNKSLIKDVDLVVDLRNTDINRAPGDFADCMDIIGNGRHLVCANKGPVVYGYKKLKDLAVEKGVRALAGCAVCAAAPVAMVGEFGFAGSKVSSFEGVVNGTTNYIISNMEKGMDYLEALNKAKASGIAEKDCDYDTKGIDTAIKTVMLANIVWNSEISLKDANIEGIDKLTVAQVRQAQKEGKRIKLIGSAYISEGKPVVNICPAAVDSSHLLYNVSEKYKAVVFNSENLGSILVSGASSLKGAAAAVLRDIANIYSEE